MTEPEIQQHIATLQRWLSGAWHRLGDPALTVFDKRELRNQMKQADVALRRCLALSVELKSARKGAAESSGAAAVRAYARPDLRFLA